MATRKTSVPGHVSRPLQKPVVTGNRTPTGKGKVRFTRTVNHEMHFDGPQQETYGFGKKEF